ncbi:MAG: hypothetical protein MJY77_02710 [Bacteroidaceae bacterium]|nr:hypothetical protein [Bacteroidaceae bacterium]
MDILLQYSELEGLVLAGTGVKLGLEPVSGDTVRVCYPLKVMGMTRNVGLSVRVVGIDCNDLKLEYSADGGAIMNMAVSSFLVNYREQIAGKVSLDNNSVTVHLSQIPGLSDKLDRFQPTGIVFDGTAVKLSVALK